MSLDTHIPDLVPADAKSVDPERAFIHTLHKLAKEAESGNSKARGALARLRRTFTGRGLSFEGLRDVGHALPDDLHRRDLDTYLLVAALFALKPHQRLTSPEEHLGKSLAKLRRALSTGAGSLDIRVTALLNADYDDLPYRLRQVVQQLASNNRSVNPYFLLSDLLKWGLPSRSVQRHWAKDYWAS